MNSEPLPLLLCVQLAVMDPPGKCFEDWRPLLPMSATDLSKGSPHSNL